MAVKPSFITGASAKVKVGGKTFAYASDVSYSVAVDVIPVETMGRYEAVNLEPVNYSVSGELSVVRYTKFAGAAANNPFQTNTNGNGLSASGLSSHFDPFSILASASVDIEIYQKQTTEVANPPGAAAGTPVPAPETYLVAKVRDARFTRLGGGINKRGILVERMSFMGLLFDGNDTSVANSGDTDLS